MQEVFETVELTARINRNLKKNVQFARLLDFSVYLNKKENNNENLPFYSFDFLFERLQKVSQ